MLPIKQTRVISSLIGLFFSIHTSHAQIPAIFDRIIRSSIDSEMPPELNNAEQSSFHGQGYALPPDFFARLAPNQAQQAGDIKGNAEDFNRLIGRILSISDPVQPQEGNMQANFMIPLEGLISVGGPSRAPPNGQLMFGARNYDPQAPTSATNPDSNFPTEDSNHILMTSLQNNPNPNNPAKDTYNLSPDAFNRLFKIASDNTIPTEERNRAREELLRRSGRSEAAIEKARQAWRKDRGGYAPSGAMNSNSDDLPPADYNPYPEASSSIADFPAPTGVTNLNIHLKNLVRFLTTNAPTGAMSSNGETNVPADNTQANIDNRNLLELAGISVLATANSDAQQVLQLLSGALGNADVQKSDEGVKYPQGQGSRHPNAVFGDMLKHLQG